MPIKTVTATDVYGDTHEVPASELVWRPSVYGIVIDGGNILLSPQHGEGRFDLPGGGVDLGEDLEAAVIREVKEETGIDVVVDRLAGVRTSFFADTHGDGGKYHSIMLYYICKKVGGEISVDGFDEREKEYAQAAQWLPLEQLDKIGVASTVDWRSVISEVL